MIRLYFVDIAFQLTELFQIEIDAAIYTDQFTCYFGIWTKQRMVRSAPFKSFLASEKVKVLNNPPNLSDLSPYDFFLFAKAQENAFWK